MKHHCQSRRALTLAETVISTLLIGFVIVSTLQLVAPLVRSTAIHADRLLAANLANELSEEIATKLFIDPAADSEDAIGFDAGDATFMRMMYDDIDDFDGWSSSPPKNSYGGAYSTMKEWTRSVKVSHVTLANPTNESVSNTGLKRVTVIVSKNGTVLSSVTTLHSQAADTLSFVVGP
tara:strand:- start:1517 stop:2050 length:534 start_codon:yes stop_codon:yes gene_type:complete